MGETAQDDEIRSVAATHVRQPGGLLPALHAVQKHFGYVPENSAAVLAELFNLSRADVHGVITFYRDFRRAKPGRHVVQVCRAEACQACGAEELLLQAERLLGCGRHETRADGAVTLEPVYCLGLCASSPALQIGEQLHARVTPQRLQALLADVADVADTADAGAAR